MKERSPKPGDGKIRMGVQTPNETRIDPELLRRQNSVTSVVCVTVSSLQPARFAAFTSTNAHASGKGKA